MSVDYKNNVKMGKDDNDNYNTCKGANTKEVDVDRAFTELIRQLASAVDQASYNTDAYKNKVYKLEYFVLECEQDLAPTNATKDSEPAPDTVLYKLRTIVNQLKVSNQKNDEILKHFSTLI